MKQLQFTAEVFDKNMQRSWKTLSLAVSDETAAMLQQDIRNAEQHCSPYATAADGKQNIVCGIICGTTDEAGNIDVNNAFGCRCL